MALPYTLDITTKALKRQPLFIMLGSNYLKSASVTPSLILPQTF
jgi:hypothetical protein